MPRILDGRTAVPNGLRSYRLSNSSVSPHLCASARLIHMEDNSVPNPKTFTEALAKLVSVPRAEMQKRVENAPLEPFSRHKRFEYVPSERPAKS